MADQIVQAGQVCFEAGRKFSQPVTSPHLVLLTVASEQGLFDAMAHLDFANVEYACFYEPDDKMGYTAMCTTPISGTQRRLFRRWPLWRELK